MPAEVRCWAPVVSSTPCNSSEQRMSHFRKQTLQLIDGDPEEKYMFVGELSYDCGPRRLSPWMSRRIVTTYSSPSVSAPGVPKSITFPFSFSFSFNSVFVRPTDVHIADFRRSEKGAPVISHLDPETLTSGSDRQDYIVTCVTVACCVPRCNIPPPLE